MDKTTQAEEFKKIFQNYLKINARSMSIRTLLSDRNLKRIDYSPYYQRNYVWDTAKQTFFIESVILGTEVPPLILFKSGNKIEVIDGRQRFETLKRFKENSFNLNISGLKELQILSKQSFNKLSPQNKEIFLDSNIRIFEFEVINLPNLSEDIIDKVKKEIFRRYNTGITPLTREELDNAKYDEDTFSELFKTKLKNDIDFCLKFNMCFFPKDYSSDLFNNEDLIAKNIDFIRRFRILNNFPILTYANGSDRTEIIDLLYDFAQNNCENPEEEYEKFELILKDVLSIYSVLSDNHRLNNKLMYECILWAISILNKEGVPFSFKEKEFAEHYSNNLHIYTEDSSHYYSKIRDRFLDTAKFFKDNYFYDFAIYIRDEEFRKKLGDLKQTEYDAAKSIEELSSLRLHKPNPISSPIDEIRTDLKSTRYILRPSYQRQEKISVLKASSIIESILLGINLPPIFIFKKDASKSKEVVDGQQRLLAILGYLGETFHNEDGVLSYSKNNNYKLRGLKILTELEGKNFNSLPYELRDKILDFVIDLIVIEEDVNPKFDPIDLFIRLNYKPYPIKNNSFEMWNSIVNYDVIRKIKELTSEGHNEWFFLREREEGKIDRMLNEELITILSYICYINVNNNEEVIGFFPRQDRITCRLKNKKALGEFLINLDNMALEKESFLRSIDKTAKIISYLKILFKNEPTKEKLNEYLNVKSSRTFRRSLQDFYVIWLILDHIKEESIIQSSDSILSDIRKMLSKLRNASNDIVDQNYLDKFNMELKNMISQYSQANND